MSAPLTNTQKSTLAQLARSALAHQRREARDEGATLEGGLFTNAFLNDETEWRHEQVSRACGKAGLTCCSQDDYATVKAHFLRLLGEDAAAQRTEQHGASNPKRVAMHKLTEQLKAARLALGYAETICQSAFHCCLADASANVVWKVYYTVKNRAAQRQKQTA